MRYLIIPIDSDPFLTSWFEYENHYSAGMKVVDLTKVTYTLDGVNWKELESDHL